MDIRHILAPTDFSAHANQAVAAALDLAQILGAKLTILHVVEPPSYLVDSHAPSHQGPLMLKAIKEQAKRELEHFLSQLPDAQVKIVRRVVVGVPYQRITESASAEQVDLIVMATQGRTGLRHLVLGSVAERVVRLAPCPVLTVRPPGANAVRGPAHRGSDAAIRVVTSWAQALAVWCRARPRAGRTPRSGAANS